MTTEPAAVLAELLVSDGPRAEFAEPFGVFAPLIGSWDLEVRYYGDDGGLVRETQGEWHFGWALDGRAVADVWITPSRDRRRVEGDGEWGLTIRIWDPELGAFRSTWMGPKHAVVMTFIGHPGDDSLVLEAREPTADKTRWIFTGITPDSFHWRNEDEAEDGTVTVRQTFDATRLDGPAAVAPTG
jgi:hypothetical protein